MAAAKVKVFTRWLLSECSGTILEQPGKKIKGRNVCQTRPVFKSVKLKMLQPVREHPKSSASKISPLVFFILEGEKQHEMIYRDSFSSLSTARAWLHGRCLIFLWACPDFLSNCQFLGYVNKQTLGKQTVFLDYILEPRLLFNIGATTQVFWLLCHYIIACMDDTKIGQREEPITI